MMNTQLKIKEIIATSWKAVMANFWVLAGLGIGYTILSVLLGIGGNLSSPEWKVTDLQSYTWWVVQLLSYALVLLFTLGYQKNIFQALDGIEPQFSAYIKQSSKFFTCFFAYTLCIIIVSIGILFLIIPGIYLSMRFQYFLAFIVEEDAGIIESFENSWKITKGHVWSLIGLNLAMLGVTIIGLALLIVGVFVAFPITVAMYAESFRKLNTLKESESLSEGYTE